MRMDSKKNKDTQKKARIVEIVRWQWQEKRLFAEYWVTEAMAFI